MLIARLIADPANLETALDKASAALADRGWPVAQAQMLEFCSDVLEILLAEGDPAGVRAILDEAFGPCDLLMAQDAITVPQVFVSDMDSTMIGQECIDELADFAGLKDKIAAITERAMQGELDFVSALRERVGLLRDLPESAIGQCLEERIVPMPGARTLVHTLNALGTHTVLVTGGFHQFADPVAEQLGFARVVGNRLAVADGRLTGELDGPVTDSAVKNAVLLEESGRVGDEAVTMAAGDGANDIPMLEAATYGMAYRAKPKARAAANGWIERGDLTSILKLLNIKQGDWIA